MRQLTQNRSDALGSFEPLVGQRSSRYAEAIRALVNRLEQRSRPLSPARIRGKRAGRDRLQDRNNTIKACLQSLEVLDYYSRAMFGRELDPAEYTSAICDDFAIWLRGEQRSPLAPDIRGLVVRAGGPDSVIAWETVRRLVERRGEVDITQIAAALPIESRRRFVRQPDPAAPVSDFSNLHRILGRIVRDYRILIRNPPLAVLRRQLGGALCTPEEKDPLRYTYTLPSRRVLSLKSVATRLSTLSMVWNSFNDVVTETGSTIIANPWRRVASDWAARAKRFEAEQRALGMRRVLSTPLLQSLTLAATGTNLESYRDVLAIKLMSYMGLRSEEVAGLLRADVKLVDDVYCLSVTGKGGKLRVLPLYSEVRDSIRDLEEAAKRGLGDYVTDEKGERSLSYASRYCAELLQDSSPLVPALVRWGANRREEPEQAARECLDTSGIRALLAKVSARARVRSMSPPGPPRPLTPEEQSLVHPHSLRHYAATAAAKGGVPMADIQQMLGHEDINTTAIYIEVPAQTSMAFSSAVSREIAGGAPLTAEEITNMRRARKWPIDDATIEAVDPFETRARSPKDETSPAIVEKPPASIGSPTWAYEEPEKLIGNYTPSSDSKAWASLVRRRETEALGRMAQAQAQGDSAGAAKFYQDMLDARATYLYNTWRVGKVSRLPWWAGRANRWPQEQMAPIMSPAQACPETASGRSMIEALEALYRDFWDNKGPSAASALVVWLGEMLDSVYVGFAKCMVEKGDTWVTFEDPADPKGKFIREHLQDEVVRWFRTYGYAAFQSGSKGAKGAGNVALVALETLPDWMWSDDPLLELPDAERKRLREWVEGLQGLRPSKQRAREIFDQIVAKMGALKTLLKTRGIAEPGWENDAEGSRLLSDIRQDLTDAYPRAAVQVVELLKDSEGWAGVALSERLRRTLRNQGIVVDDAVVVAPVLGQVDPKYASHIFDAAHLSFDSRNTIVHSTVIKKAWFEKYGTDSECVARRALRVLWDRRTRTARSQAHGLIIRHFDMQLASVLPCSAEVERRMRESGWKPDTDVARAAQMRSATWKVFIEGMKGAQNDSISRSQEVFAPEANFIRRLVQSHAEGLILQSDLVEVAEAKPSQTARQVIATARKNESGAARSARLGAMIQGAGQWDGPCLRFPAQIIVDFLKDRQEQAILLDTSKPAVWFPLEHVRTLNRAAYDSSKATIEVDFAQGTWTVVSDKGVIGQIQSGVKLPDPSNTLSVSVPRQFETVWVDGGDTSIDWPGYPLPAREDFQAEWVKDLPWPDSKSAETPLSRLQLCSSMRTYARRKRSLLANQSAQSPVPSPIRAVFAGVWTA